jgi:hypothetical protein
MMEKIVSLGVFRLFIDIVHTTLYFPIYSHFAQLSGKTCYILNPE